MLASQRLLVQLLQIKDLLHYLVHHMKTLSFLVNQECNQHQVLNDYRQDPTAAPRNC